MKLLLVCLLVAVAPGATSLEFARPVELAAGASQQYVVVDAQVWSHARADLGDLRLYAGGTEIPYVLQTIASGASPGNVDCKVLQPSTVGGKTQFILDMTHSEVYDRVYLDLATKDFVANAKIEGANDVHASSWALLGNSSLFDFTTEGLGRNSTLQMPDATFRYLRVTLDGPVPRQDVTSAQASRWREAHVVWITLAEKPAVEQQGKDTVLTFDLPPKVPVERVQVEVGSSGVNFLRNVEALTGDAKKGTERQVGSGTLTHVHLIRGGKQIDEERSDLPVFVRWEKPHRDGERAENAANDTVQDDGKLRVVIHNGDDRPLEILNARLQQEERRLYFQSPSQSQATLYYGDERLDAPSYDYAKFFQPEPAAGQARLLAQALNAEYQKPADGRPWSERHPAAMWTAIVGAILVLGVVVLRSLRSIPT